MAKERKFRGYGHMRMREIKRGKLKVKKIIGILFVICSMLTLTIASTSANELQGNNECSDGCYVDGCHDGLCILADTAVGALFLGGQLRLEWLHWL